jgi:hypothetical protein
MVFQVESNPTAILNQHGLSNTAGFNLLIFINNAFCLKNT